MQEIVGLPQELESADYSSAAEGKKLWIIPTRAEELYLADRLGASRVAKKDFINVYSTNKGRLGWLIPRVENGIYVTSSDGQPVGEGKPLLAGENVLQIYARWNKERSYVWVRTEADRLYAFMPEETPQGWIIRPLNKGLPLKIGTQDLAVDLVGVTGSGEVIWVTAPSRFAPPNAWGDVYRAEIRGEGVSVTPVPRQYYEGKPVNTLFWDYENPWRFWAKSPDLCFYEVRLSSQSLGQSKLLVEPSKIFDHHSSCVFVEHIVPSSIPGRYWIKATPTYYLMGPASDVSEVALVLGNSELNLKTVAAPRLRFAPHEGSTLQARLDWPTRDDHPLDLDPDLSKARSHIHVSFLNPKDHQALPRMEGEGFADKGKAEVTLHTDGKSHWNEKFDIQLEYVDPKTLTDFRIIWRGVTLAPTLYELILASPYWKGLWVLTVPTVALLLALGRSWRIRRWVPVAVSATEMLIVSRLPEPLRITPGELFFVIAAAFISLLLAGLISPTLFRELASLQPFRLLVPSALQLPRLRRLIFKDYVAHLRMLLQRFREEASEETYVPLAATASGCRLPAGLTIGPQVGLMEIAATLTAEDPQKRVNLLIEAPGGRGKSALWNELLECCLAAFEKNPLCPIPVIGDSRCKTVESMVESGLGRFRISADLTAAQLKSGEFSVFLDNLSSAGLTPADLETFFRSGGESTRLCLANRPDGEWRGAVRRADSWLIVEPERLTDSSVGNFVEAYAIADAKRANRDVTAYVLLVKEKVKSFLPVCRSEDGSYLPLLVRLCTLAIERDVTSIDDIYQSALKRLLTRRPNMKDLEIERLLVEAESLSLETYWHGHDRVFRFERSTPEHTQTVRELLQAGIVVRADSIKRLTEEPKQVRFFHDSVQSYLVARGLHRAGEWSCFLQAAGDPDFYRAASDLTSGTGSELFQMCLYVFECDRVKRLLGDDLLNWAGQYRATLSIDEVRVGLSQENQAATDAQLPSLAGAGEYLRIAVGIVVAEDAQDVSNNQVGRLYAQLAPKIWQRISTKESHPKAA